MFSKYCLAGLSLVSGALSKIIYAGVNEVSGPILLFLFILLTIHSLEVNSVLLVPKVQVSLDDSV